MVDNIEQRVYELIRPYAGVYLFSFEPVELTLESDLDADLYLEDLDASELMDTFFSELHVERGNFNIKTYYPDIPFSWNLFPCLLLLSACWSSQQKPVSGYMISR